MRLTLVLLALCIAAVNAFCPAFLKVPSPSSACSCTDYVDGAIIKCNGPNGTMVVEELKKAQVEVRELTLENANIVEIGPRAFKNLRIKKLVLDNNRINKIHADAFRGLEGVLQELSIASNNLTEVPTEAMEGLRTLNIVNLRCNKIGNLTDVAFMNMPSLIEINLGCNQICKIGSKAFKEIKTTIQNVILDNNCLEHIPTKALDGMQFLIALHAKYNNIEKLARHELRNLTSLSMLTLTGNKISYMDKEFVQNAPNVRYIYMGENELKSIESGTLQQFKQAEILDLSYNDLPEITADLFQGLEMLQHLNLEGNSIRDIATGAFQSMPLLLLWLPYNCLTAVTSKMFQGAPFLKQVSLAHNNIRSIEQFSFAHLANLHTLDLSHNKLMTVQQTALQGTDFLTIRMQENPMVCNQDGFHVMNGHEAINLTTEANLICHTDYVHDLTDKCPTRKEMPVRPPCCQSQMRRMITTTTAPMTKAPTSPPSEETEVPVTEEVMAEEEQTEATTQARRLPPGVEAARRFNMERFRKLSRRPMDPLGVVVRGAPPQTNDLNMALDSTRPRQVIRANLPTLLPKATEVGASELRKEASSSSAMVDFSSDDAPQVAQKEEMAMHRS